jgi:hypothetical protein
LRRLLTFLLLAVASCAAPDPSATASPSRSITLGSEPSLPAADLTGTFNADPREILHCGWLETPDGIVQVAWPPSWDLAFDPPRLIDQQSGRAIRLWDQVGLEGSFVRDEAEYCGQHLHADARRFWATDVLYVIESSP